MYSFGESINSTIQITFNATWRNQFDPITAFSVNDKYFANLNVMDAGFNRFGDPNPGQWIYPQCAFNLAINNDLEHVFENIGTEPNEHLQALVASGNLSEWHAAGTGIGDSSSVTYKITNDGINNRTYFRFNSGDVGYNCEFEDSFDTDADIYFYIQNDCSGNEAERSWFHSFDIQAR